MPHCLTNDMSSIALPAIMCFQQVAATAGNIAVPLGTCTIWPNGKVLQVVSFVA